MNDEAARKQAEESSVLADLGRIVNSSLEIDEVYRRIGREVAKLLKFDRLCITVIDQGNESFSNTFITGLDIPKLRVGQAFPL